MKFKPLKQRDHYSCGPTSLAMLAKFFKLDISLKEIEKITRYYQRKGLSHRELLESAKKIGFRTKEVRFKSWASLKKAFNNPGSAIIVSWMLKGHTGHFSVVDKITDKYIVLADPNDGKLKKINKIEFLQLWFDYDVLYPKKPSDINLRWGVVVGKK